MTRACTLLLFDMLLVDLAILDYKKRMISNRSITAILCLSILSIFLFPEISPGMRTIGMFAVSVPMTILALCIRGSFGGGDVKLVFACGAFLGWKILMKGVVLAVFMAGCYSFWLLFIKRKQKNVQFALGPFLSAGFIISSCSLF